MVFGYYIILNTPFISEWEAIMKSNQNLIHKNNQPENKNRKPHTYTIQDKVLVCNKKVNKYEYPYVGPYPITQVWTNGNFAIRRCFIQKCINI